MPWACQRSHTPGGSGTGEPWPRGPGRETWAAEGLGVALLGQRLEAASQGSSLTSSQTEDRRESPFPSTAEVLLLVPRLPEGPSHVL